MTHQRVTFVNHADLDTTRPFTPYEFHAGLANNNEYAGIRGLLRDNFGEWMEELADELDFVAREKATQSRWWWCLSSTRLDARPWGEEKIIKRYFFARATAVWLERNQNVSELQIADAPHEVANYLKFLCPQLDVTWRAQMPTRPYLSVIKDQLRPYVYLWRQVTGILRHHAAMRQPQKPTGVNFVLFESLGKTSLADGHRYYFTDHFDGPAGCLVSLLSLGIIEAARRPNEELSPPRRALLDWCRPGDAAYGFVAALHVARFARSIERSVEPRLRCPDFWRDYLVRTFDIAAVATGYCTYRALLRLGRPDNGMRVVYPYEEKGIERAILFACEDLGCEALGFGHHPQPTVVEALRDRPEGGVPKPARYAFCGPAYVGAFRKWGRKATAPMSVWGTIKSRNLAFNRSPHEDTRLRLLILLSHATELRQLDTWLGTLPNILDAVSVTLRMYRADDLTEFERDFKRFRTRHPGVFITEGKTLEQDVLDSDVTAFAATSAGPEAVLMGRLAIFVDINDAFDANPCFDDLAAYLPCRTPGELAKRLAMLRMTDPEALAALHDQQRAAAMTVFAPVDGPAVIADLTARGD